MPATPCLEDYPLRTFDKLRYGDTDRQGHVNNAVFSTFLETGRVELSFGAGAPLIDEGCSLVIAHLSLDFVAELLWPGRVDIGTGITLVGRSSIRMEQALFQEGRLVALADTVTVQVSNATHRGYPLSERAQAYLANYRKAPRARDPAPA